MLLTNAQDVFNPEDVSNVIDPFHSDVDDVGCSYLIVALFFNRCSQDDIAFGPFPDSDSTGSDPFTFTTSFSDEMDDGSFDTFGDFGDFQTAQDGELTPTTGSWSFTSGGSTASDDAGSEDSGGLADDPFRPHTSSSAPELEQESKDGL